MAASRWVFPSSCRAPALWLLLGAAFAGPTGFAQTTTTWTSTTSTSWNTAGNWNNGVPTSTSNAVIGTTSSDHFTVTLDTNANVNNLTLSEGSTLTFNPNQSLTVSGSLGTPHFATDLDGQTNVAYGTLSLDSTPSSTSNININNGTITLATLVLTIDGHQFTVDSGTLNGTSTLENTGTIQGSGTISLNVTNTGTINNNDGGTLSITGNIQNNGGTILNSDGLLSLSGGYVSGGTIVGGIVSIHNETLNGVSLASGPLQLTPGSTITVGSNGLTNVGSLYIGDGTTISGPGLLTNGSGVTGSSIIGGGTISADISNNGFITSNSATAPLVLQGTVTQAKLGAGIGIGSGDLILDGANIVNGSLTSAGTNLLDAKNGAVLTDVTVGQANSTVQLSGGSTLGIFGGITVQGDLQLGSATQGANLTSVSANPEILITVNSTLDGGGTVGPAIFNNGSIVADNPSAALVLQGNVTGSGTISATNGATLTLDPISVSAASVAIGTGSTLNGNGTITTGDVSNAGTLSTGAGAAGQITVIGKYLQETGGILDFSLGGTGAGQFSQLFVNGNDPNGLIPFAEFDPASIIDAQFLAGFDPSSGCTTVFGVCESFDVLDVSGGSISGFSNITFELPTLPTGFEWLALDENNNHDIVLEIEGAVSSTGGGGGGSSGGTTGVPEPSSIGLLGIGLATLACMSVRKRAAVAR